MSSSHLNALETGFLVGFLEAEAHFYVAPSNGGQSMSCGITLAARDDDAALIVALRDITGLGQLVPRAAYRTSRPQIGWTITTQAETAAVASLLRRYPPIGRKAQVSEVWCKAVEAWTSSQPERLNKTSGCERTSPLRLGTPKSPRLYAQSMSWTSSIGVM